MSDAASHPIETAGTADLSGRHVGDFQLLRRLGRGAMAEVYLAEQGQLKRRVAIKVLRPELADDQTYLKRFEREAQAAASLVHANIVQIHEVGHEGRLHYMVQEYVQGQNLRDWLARGGPPNFSQALSIMRQVAAALAKAAEEDVIHRDIKPENIMVTSSGEVKVADFGLARIAGQLEPAELTQIGVTLGTPLYMSPEQVEGRPLDPRSDIYSFGITCYHMLAGNPPFTGETSLAVAVQHLKTEPRPLESLRPDLPPALCRVVHKMLCKDPARRWQSARELLGELCRIRLHYGVEATPEDLAEWESLGLQPLADSRVRATRKLDALMKQTATRPSARRAKWMVALALVLAFVLGGGVAWFAAHDGLSREPADGVLRIPRQPTALRQWYYASQIGTAEAWRAVIDYFPEKEYMGNRAKQQLARIYLRERDYDRAMAVCDELAAASDLDSEFRAFGLAGKCGVLTLQGKYRESAEVLDALWPIHIELRDAQMRKMLDYVMRENRSKLGPQTARQWDRWLDEQFRPEG